MRKQNSYINYGWLALMHGLFINPKIKPADKKPLNLEPFEPELVNASTPNMLRNWQVGPGGELSLSYK